MKTKIFTEAIDLSEARLDSEARVLRNVTLITAGLSKNRRLYPASVLEKAAPLFEGAKAYNDHDFMHKVTDLTGWYSNVRFENDRLIADRHFTRNQAGQDVMLIAEDIVSKRAPASLSGLSIAVVGEGKARKFEDGSEGIEVVTITAAQSVDDVTDPAAGGSYFAAGGGDGLAEKLLAALDFEDWQAARPDLVARLKKEWKHIRLDESTKAALTEADRKVKAAEADAGAHQQALSEAQAAIQRLTAEREAAAAGEAAARRELAIVEALYTTPGLPAAWRESLRETLRKAEPKQWQTILQREKQKAQQTPRERVPVTGAEAQVHTPSPPTPGPLAVLPREGETTAEWVERMQTLQI